MAERATAPSRARALAAAAAALVGLVGGLTLTALTAGDSAAGHELSGPSRDTAAIREMVPPALSIWYLAGTIPAVATAEGHVPAGPVAHPDARLTHPPSAAELAQARREGNASAAEYLTGELEQRFDAQLTSTLGAQRGSGTGSTAAVRRLGGSVTVEQWTSITVTGDSATVVASVALTTKDAAGASGRWNVTVTSGTEPITLDLVRGGRHGWSLAAVHLDDSAAQG